MHEVESDEKSTPSRVARCHSDENNGTGDVDDSEANHGEYRLLESGAEPRSEEVQEDLAHGKRDRDEESSENLHNSSALPHNGAKIPQYFI